MSSVRLSVCPSVRLSVCLSVTLVDQDHISRKSWKLTARTIISPTPSLFVAQRPPTNLLIMWFAPHLMRSVICFNKDFMYVCMYLLPGEDGEIWGRLEKMALWSTKAALSLKRVKIEKKLLWGTSFERYHPRPPTASPSLRLGVRTPPKTPIAIISGTGKATNFKLDQNNNSVHPNNSP